MDLNRKMQLVAEVFEQGENDGLHIVSYVCTQKQCSVLKILQSYKHQNYEENSRQN